MLSCKKIKGGVIVRPLPTARNSCIQHAGVTYMLCMLASQTWWFWGERFMANLHLGHLHLVDLHTLTSDHSNYILNFKDPFLIVFLTVHEPQISHKEALKVQHTLQSMTSLLRPYRQKQAGTYDRWTCENSCSKDDKKYPLS